MLSPAGWESIQNYIDTLVCLAEGGCKEMMDADPELFSSPNPAQDLRAFRHHMDNAEFRLKKLVR